MVNEKGGFRSAFHSFKLDLSPINLRQSPQSRLSRQLVFTHPSVSANLVLRVPIGPPAFSACQNHLRKWVVEEFKSEKVKEVKIEFIIHLSGFCIG